MEVEIHPWMEKLERKLIVSEELKLWVSEWEELPRSSVNDSLEDRWWLMEFHSVHFKELQRRRVPQWYGSSMRMSRKPTPCHIRRERRTDLLESSLYRKTEMTTAWGEESSIRMTRWRNCPEVRWWRTFLKTCQFHREEAGLELKEGWSITMY